MKKKDAKQLVIQIMALFTTSFRNNYISSNFDKVFVKLDQEKGFLMKEQIAVYIKFMLEKSNQKKANKNNSHSRQSASPKHRWVGS